MNAIWMSKAQKSCVYTSLDAQIWCLWFFFVPPVFHIRLDCYPISVFTLIPAQNDSDGDRFMLTLGWWMAILALFYNSLRVVTIICMIILLARSISFIWISEWER